MSADEFPDPIAVFGFVLSYSKLYVAILLHSRLIPSPVASSPNPAAAAAAAAQQLKE